MPAKKKKSEVELLPPETLTPTTKPAKRKVEAVHTIKYTAPVEVDAPEDDEEEPEEIEIEEEPEVEEEPEQEYRPKRPPTIRQQLQDRLAHIGGSEQLRLRIDRLPYYEVNGMTGVKADKEFMGVVDCTIEFFDGDAYLIETARRYGPGQYWFTLRQRGLGRKMGGILKTWDERIGGQQTAQQSIASQSEGSQDSGHSTIIYQPAQQPSIQPRSFKQELREMVETVELMRKLNPEPEKPTASQPALSIDEQVAVFAMKQPDLAKKAFKNLLGGDSGEKDTLELILNNVEPIGRALQGLVDRVFMNINQMRGDNNGQATMAQTALQTDNQNQFTQSEIQRNAMQMDSAHGKTMEESDYYTSNQSTSSPVAQASAEDTLLHFVLDQCARKVPVKITADRIIKMADAINEQSPAQSIDGYLELFVSVTPEAVLEYVKTSVPNGEQITAMEHSLEWTGELQKALGMFFAQDGGENEPS